MISPWRSEVHWIVWLAAVGLFAGKLSGFYFPVLWLCCLVYLGRHLYHLNRLLLWLRGGGKAPGGGGIWDEIYYLIYRLRRRNKRRKKRLIVMLERFRTATAALPDATVVLGPRDEIEWFNEAAGKLLGLRKSDVGQQIINLLRYPRFSQFLRESAFEGTVSVPSPVREEAELEIRVVPYGDDLRLLVAQDVSHLRFMERVRADFVANVSHELRTPLTVMKGYLEALADAEGEVPERYHRMLRRMQEQTNRMQNLIDGLLSLTRLEAGPHVQNQPVSMAPLLRGLCDEARLLADCQASLELSLESEADLSGVESELRGAFSNLIVNALKYTPSSGRVQVCWRDDPAGVRFEVADNGPGIAREHLPRLTERFYRVEVEDGSKRVGVGLGLAIVKHVLSRHEGELQIYSELGKGSRFSCVFPEKRVLRPLAAQARA
ncbi:phosphate regulon sensor histidine kinase PhoR [Methyloterricola oryzae]|uniref:phosphate regulon sensor histidine kinase PhoR n=1 Tax=Methyloterricola oryzae TaxID=1495050 RepID=UPI00069A74DE|nr:phosphate regulon sensor histidine kinase PhoR [Methyloterricola oryzae]